MIGHLRSPIIAGLIATTAAQASIATTAESAPQGNTMVTATEIGSMLTRLGPSLFQGSRQALTNVELSAARTDFRGLAVAAPPQVPTDTQPAVPLIVLSQRTSLQAWQVPEQYNLMLAVTDTDSGNLRLTRALVDPKDEEALAAQPLPRSPAPAGNAATAVSTKVHRLDLPVQPGLSANLAIAALSFDTVSNTVPISLAGSRPRAPTAPRPVAPEPHLQAGLPTYLPTSQTPKAPAAGLDFAITLPDGPAPARLIVHGAFVKSLAMHEYLRSPRRVRDNGADRQATAIVPLSIAVLGLNWKAPRLQSLGVPVYGMPDVPPGQRITGQFAVEMPLNVGLPAGDYVAYVLMDGTPYGPRKFQVK